MSSLRARSLRDILTFTRASTAMYCNVAGLLVTAAIDEPRIEYDPVTLTPRGLLIEREATNVLLRSAEFDLTWTPTRASVTVDAVTAPDGTLSGDMLVEDSTASNSHYLSQSYTKGSSTEVQAYAASIWAKAATRTGIRLKCQGTDGTDSAEAQFDLSAGSVGTVTGAGSYENAQARIEKWPGGWYRCMVEFLCNNDGQADVVFLVFLTSGGATSYSGDGASGLYLFGAQLEKGNYATSYVPTTTAAVTKRRDLCSVAALQPWFTEEAGTIYVEYSEPWTPIAHDSVSRRLVQVDDGTESNRQLLYINAGNRVASTTLNGSAEALISRGTHAAGVVQKQVMSWATDAVSATASGSTVSTDSAATMPTDLTTFRLGHASAAGGEFIGYLRKVRYWPRTLSDNELQALVA